jgi:[acyl-carrier-protein] S-malonyltransferase
MAGVVYLFPGQGSQEMGMGADFYRKSDKAKGLFDRADAILGFSLSSLCFNGPEEELRQTINTQPALYVASCAAYSIFEEKSSVEPFAVAGHSVGEYAALYAAGAMSFETGLRLVRKRAELMQENAQKQPGAMSAILGLEPAEVKAICEEARSTGIIAIANFNSPGQIVISGEQKAVEKASELAKSRGAKKVIPLAVSGGFHSPLMVSAGDALYPYLREAIFKQTRCPVVVNVTAEYCSNGVDFAPYLTMQVSGSVRWEESMKLLIGDGADFFVELGSGSVLTGLLKRIDKSVKSFSVTNMESLDTAAQSLRAEPMQH